MKMKKLTFTVRPQGNVKILKMLLSKKVENTVCILQVKMQKEAMKLNGKIKVINSKMNNHQSKRTNMIHINTLSKVFRTEEIETKALSEVPSPSIKVNLLL